MYSTLKSTLKIQTKIWKNETFELVDYDNPIVMRCVFEINTSGMLIRDKKTTYYVKGENIKNNPYELLKIKRDKNNGYYYINGGTYPKNLSDLVEENPAFMVYRSISYKDYEVNSINKYYVLSQGDIFKLGRIYFKVLEINLFSEKEMNQYETEININDSKCTLQRSQSFQSAIINGKKVIKGVMMPKTSKYENNQNINYNQSSNKNVNLFDNNIINDNEVSIYTNTHLKNKNSKIKINISRLRKLCFPRTKSAEDLLSLKKNRKISNITQENYSNINNINDNTSIDDNKFNLNKTKDNKTIKKKLCRICYGDENTIENPLLSPCICKGSMQYIHYICLKNWIYSKIKSELDIRTVTDEEVGITYCSKDIACELCKSKFPDYVNHNGKLYNITFYKPKFKQYIVLESMRTDRYKNKFIHILSLVNKKRIVLGRANDCDLSIPELSVSRYHCCIHIQDKKLILEDNNSKFGSLILLQNPNLLLIDNHPLKLQKNRTHIKIKLLLPFNFFSCCNINTFDYKVNSYQAQNKKCFNIVSCFVIKDEITSNDENENEEESFTKTIKVGSNNIKKIKIITKNNNKKENKKHIDCVRISNISAEDKNVGTMININSEIKNKCEISSLILDNKDKNKININDISQNSLEKMKDKNENEVEYIINKNEPEEEGDSINLIEDSKNEDMNGI